MITLIGSKKDMNVRCRKILLLRGTNPKKTKDKKLKAWFGERKLEERKPKERDSAAMKVSTLWTTERPVKKRLEVFTHRSKSNLQQYSNHL